MKKSSVLAVKWKYKEAPAGLRIKLSASIATATPGVSRQRDAKVEQEAIVVVVLLLVILILGGEFSTRIMVLRLSMAGDATVSCTYTASASTAAKVLVTGRPTANSSRRTKRSIGLKRDENAPKHSKVLRIIVQEGKKVGLLQYIIVTVHSLYKQLIISSCSQGALFAV